MIFNLLLGLLGIAGTVSIQSFGSVYLTSYIHTNYFELSTKKFLKKRVQLLIFVAFFLLILHFCESLVWAIIYYADNSISDLETFESAVYFSLVTFTTLGYGDITITSPEARLLSGFEAINGVILLGWSTSILFSVVQEIMSRLEIKSKKS